MSDVWRLFRFRRIGKYLKQELERSEFFCADPDKLNDPFDCRFNVCASIDRVLAKPLDTQRRDILNHLYREFSRRHPADRMDGRSMVGVCCFSDTWDIPVMWTHYAREYSGVCLRYEFPREYFVARYPIPSTDGMPGLLGISGVRYEDDGFSTWLETGQLLDKGEPYSPLYNAIQKLFSTKSKGWFVEREARIVLGGERSIGFEPHCLKQVIFGMRTKPYNMAMLASIARQRNPDVQLSQVTSSDTADYGLMLKPYESRH